MLRATPGTIFIANDMELADHRFVRMTRETLTSLEVSPSHMVDYLHTIHSRLDVTFINSAYYPAPLNLAEIDTDPEDADLLDACPREEALRYWFHSLMQPFPPEARPYVTVDTRERFRVVASILIAAQPDLPWPRTLPANDNLWAANDQNLKKASLPPKRGPRNPIGPK